MNPKYLLCLLLLCLTDFAFGQNKTLQLNLDQVISMAQSNAPAVNIAKAQLNRNKLQYEQFLIGRKPLLELSGRLPYSRSILVEQDSGKVTFVPTQSFSGDIDLSLSKPLNTGGHLSISTGLSQNANFPIDDSNVFFLSTPVYIFFSQPFFGFNNLKWDKKVQPLIVEEAEREYTEQLADVAQQSVGYFFNLYIAQLDLESARMDKQNADELYALSKGRFSVGKIAETDLLQMDLRVMQAETRVAQATLEVETSTGDMHHFLQVAPDVEFKLIAPEGIPEYLVNADIAIQQAAASRKYKLTQQRQLVEAERSIERSKKENGVSVDLSAGFGLSKSDSTLPGAYGWPPEDQESVSIGVRIPIADWGRAKIDRRLAEIDQEILQQNIEQENINFERTIITKIRQLDIVRSQLKIAEKANEVAKKRYDITKKRYTVGKVDVTELNLALSEQTSARQSLMQALRSFWATHYEMQRLTLYDFERGEVLNVE